MPLLPTKSTVDQNARLGAAVETLGYLSAIAAATVAFLVGWLRIGQCVVLVLLLLLSLVALAWKRFDGGRHPCFLFLCLVTLFQAGRMIAYCAGGVADVFRIELMTAYPFDVPHDMAGAVLLSLALSAVFVYAPCRWAYRPAGPVHGGGLDRFLPYLYLLLWISVPVQLFKNYRYYQYARDNGGYLVFFIDHGGLAASIPSAVRAISLISLPALIGIFVIEQRRKFIGLTAAVYFLTAAPLLVTGSRGAIFCLVLSLWYLAKIKSGKRSRFCALALVAGALVLIGSLIGGMRVADGKTKLGGPLDFLADQGMSLNVTAVAIAAHDQFARHMPSYLWSELQVAFVAADQTNYVVGKRIADDIAMYLNPVAFRLGFGSGSSYLAEAYLAGGLVGVVVVSGLIGLLLQGLHIFARSPLGLFLVVMILPDVLWMTRAGLLDWVSVSLRVVVSVFLLLIGWHLYRLVCSIQYVLKSKHPTRPCCA